MTIKLSAGSRARTHLFIAVKQFGFEVKSSGPSQLLEEKNKETTKINESDWGIALPEPAS